MSRKNVGGRPGVKSWEATLAYTILDEEGNETTWQQLKHEDENKKKTSIFDNAQDAIDAFEDLQIDGTLMYTIFVRLNNAYNTMQPAEQTRIKYKHLEETFEETVDDIPEVEDNLLTPEEEKDLDIAKEDDDLSGIVD